MTAQPVLGPPERRTVRPSAYAGRRVALPAVLVSEWIKLRSLRSTWFSLLAAAVAVIAVAPFNSRRGGVSLDGLFAAQVPVGVLGVVFVTGEYATGMIRSSFAAVPRRSVVVLAKALVFAGVVFVVSIAAVVPAFVIGETVRSGQVRAALHTPGVPRAIIAAAVYLTVLGLLAVGLGFLIRSTAGAVSTLFATVFAAPMLALFLPYPTSAHLGRLLPFNALLQAITTDRELNLDSFGPWQGIAVMGAWALLAMSAGLFLVLRRNA